MKRKIMLVMAAIVMVLLGSASAAAASPAVQASDWSCDGDVCMRYVPDGVIGPLDSSGCSRETCLNLFGRPSAWSAVGYADDDWYGHVDVWGPGRPIGSSGDHVQPTTAASGKGSGSVCAQGWESIGGGRYTSRGLPCLTVY